MRTIGILMFENVEELDVVGPWEVLASWCRRAPDDGWDVVTFSRDGGMVDCYKGMRFAAHHSYADVPRLDVLVYPGGPGVREQLDDEEQLEWTRRQRAEVPLLTSVCSGSLVFAKAGLLKGRPATSHWSVVDMLTELDPTIEPRPDDRFVDDGDVITSAGMSAGIDMALHLVARLAGVERARKVRRGIQYDPEPPV